MTVGMCALIPCASKSEENVDDKEQVIQNTSQEAKEKIWTKSFVLIALINLTIFLGFNITNTGMPVYVASLGASDVTVGFITTLCTVTALFIRPFAGIMLDKFGRKGILLFSLAIMVLVIIAYGVFPIVGVLLSLRLIHGITWGLSSTATSTIAAQTIPKQRFGEGMGYFALTTALAVAIGPAVSLGLLENVGIIPMISVAAASTVLAFVLTLLQNPDPKKGSEAKEAEFMAQGSKGNGAEQETQEQQKEHLKLSDLFDKRAMFPGAIMLLINIAFAALVTFIALHGQEQGVSNIFLYFTVYAIVTLISRPLIGKVIDRVGFFVPGIVSVIGVVITLIIVAFSSNIYMFSAAGVFAGLGIGTAMSTFQTMAVAAVPAHRKGVATSTFLFCFDAGIGAGALIAGAIAHAVGYSTMYLIMGAFPLVACIIFIMVGKQRIAQYSVSDMR